MGKVQRRDFLKGLAAIPFLGYFAFAFKKNIGREISANSKNIYETLKINQLDAPKEKLLPPAGSSGNRLRLGLVGNGWRGEQLLHSLGYVHPKYIEKNTVNGGYTKGLQDFLNQEDLHVEFAAVCDTFDVHTKRGVEISKTELHPGGKRASKPAKVFSSYREMVKSDDIDAIIIATPDHSHALIAIESSKPANMFTLKNR